MFKVAFSLFLSIAIGINVDVNIEINNFYELIRCTAIETANGLVLGYIVNICFYTLKMAGKLIDNQLGLSMASTYDPNTQSQSTIIENLMYFVGIVIFFVVDAHHILIYNIQCLSSDRTRGTKNCNIFHLIFSYKTLDAKKNMIGAVMITLSKRSKIPPCPGISFP